MSAKNDATLDVIESWLSDTEDFEKPDLVLRQLLLELPGTPQLRPWWPIGRITFTSDTVPIALAAAAAAVVAVAVVGILRLPSFTFPGGPTTSASPSASPSASSSSTPRANTPEGDYVLDLDTGVMTPLPKAIRPSIGDEYFGKYAASPDGSRLAYVGTGDDGNLQIFIAGIDGTAVRQVTHDLTGATHPAWSPDGATIAYVGHGSGGVGNLFILDVATGRLEQVTDEADQVGGGTQFTPDGTSLLYTCYR